MFECNQNVTSFHGRVVYLCSQLIYAKEMMFKFDYLYAHSIFARVSLFFLCARVTCFNFDFSRSIDLKFHFSKE